MGFPLCGIPKKLGLPQVGFPKSGVTKKWDPHHVRFLLGEMLKSHLVRTPLKVEFLLKRKAKLALYLNNHLLGHNMCASQYLPF